MKNPENFDYDKKKPANIKKYVLQNEQVSNKDEDYNKIMNEPPLIKGIDFKQNTSTKIKKANKSKSKTNISKDKMKINNSKLSFKSTVDKKEKTNNKINDNVSNISETKNLIKINETEKEDLGFIMPTLPETEIIEPDEPLPEEDILPNQNFCKNYVSNLLIPIKQEIDPNILSGVEIGLNKVLVTLQDDLEENKLEINQEQKNVNEIKNDINKSSMIPKYPVANFESSIKMQKIKELSQRKKNIVKQINQIDENIRLIDEEKSTNFGGAGSGYLDYPSNVVEENIKKDQLKENKQIKELLIAKLSGINEQVQKLMENEEEFENMKKLNVKEFLDNFEKSKEKAEEMAKKYEDEKKIREQKIMNSVRKSLDRKQSEYEQMKLEEKERRKRELERTRLKELERIRGRTKENTDKLNYIRQHVNDKPANINEYLFKALENKYKEKAQQEIQLEIMKHKEKMKENSVSLEEIFDFEKKQKELELKRLAEIEEEKKKLKEQWKQAKDILPKFESSVMQIVKEEEKKNKEKKEMEEFKKKLKQQEIKNYGEVVNKLFLPKINQSMKKEREERIKNLDIKNNVQHITKKKNNGRILLKKPDPNKPSKYSWKLKLELDEQEKINKNKNLNQSKRARSAQKREPLEKLPDYLTEMRNKNEKISNNSQTKFRTNDWDKMLKNNKGNLMENVEKVKKKAEELENKAKMNEKLLQNTSGGIDFNLQQKVSGYYLDSIKAKLSILENINQK